jgi:hypothetical protein
MKLKFTDEQFKELWSQGLNDVQIAERLGVTPEAVGHRRRKVGLPRNPCKKETKEKLKELHSRGLTDVQIAREMGLRAGTVGTYRRDLGLPPNFPKCTCVVCGTEFASRSPFAKLCSYECRMKYYLWGLPRPRPPRHRLDEMYSALEGIKGTLNSIDESLKKTDEHTFLEIKADFRYIQERLGRIFITFPELAKEVGFAVDGVPKLLRKGMKVVGDGRD